MEQIKDKVTKWLKKCQTNLKGYKLVEKQKRIFFFSNFSLDIDEFYQIYIFIKNIKENVFMSLRTEFKCCANSFVAFNTKNNLNEEDKIMIIFSALFLHYYSSFSYNTNNLFEDFFNISLLKLCESFKINIKNMPKFQSFSFDFYKKMQSTINNYNYELIKNYFQFYNASLVTIDNEVNDNVNNNLNFNNNNMMLNLNNSNNNFSLNNNNSNNNISLNINGNKNGIKFFQNKFLIQLISAKERIVDMVFEITNKNNINNNNNNINKNSIEMNFISSSLEKINKASKEHLKDSMNVDSGSDSENESKFIPNPNKNTNNNEITEYSRRVLCELQKCETDEHTNVIVSKLSAKINDYYLDKVLNWEKKYKKITVINCFICYVVEFNSELIKNIEGNNNNNELYNDLNLRFIVPAKEIYNLVLEIYFSICDLSFTNINTFYEMCLQKGIQMRYAVNLYPFFRRLTKILVNFNNKYNNNINNNVIMEVFQQLFDLEFSLWKKEINEKGQQLTSFCKI